MNCKKCKKEIPEEAVFCPWCGRKQVAEHRVSHRPHGAGTVYKIAGRKNKPWAAMLTVSKSRVFLGTFRTETEAKCAIESALVNGVSSKNTYTLEALYEEWSEVHYRALSASGTQGYKTAWKYLQPLAKMKVRDLRTIHFQECIDTCAQQYSRSQCEKIRQLASQLCKKAMEYDLLNKNYAQFLAMPKEKAKDRNVFTQEEIKLLKQNDFDVRAQIILTLIYTGFRPNELFSVRCQNVDLTKGYIIGGSKTAAGINRKVPIHPYIRKYIENWYNSSIKEGGTTYLIRNQSGNKMDLKNFRSRQFYPILLDLGILELPNGQTGFSKEFPPRLTPYCARHTLATLATTADIKPEILKEILGHEDYTTTVNYYEHFTIEELQKEIEKIE